MKCAMCENEFEDAINAEANICIDCSTEIGRNKVLLQISHQGNEKITGKRKNPSFLDGLLVQTKKDEKCLQCRITNN